MLSGSFLTVRRVGLLVLRFRPGSKGDVVPLFLTLP